LSRIDWLYRWYTDRRNRSSTEVATASDTSRSQRRADLPGEILWLLDAPLFIDAVQVDAFYDAILRPDYERTSVALSQSIDAETTIGGKLTLGFALPWFAKAEAEGTAETKRGSGHGTEVTLNPVSNAYRHLVALALYYAAQSGDSRLVIAKLATQRIEDGSGTQVADRWLTPDFIEAAPRCLVFLDMPAGSKFIPTALELTNGSVNVLIDELGKEIAGKSAAKYTRDDRNEYFQWFTNNFESRMALDVVENAVHDHPVAWIDYNVALPPGGPFLHLHLVGRGIYDTGVFAYNFINRGFNHGLRIVGTLKSGPDLNVLAVFER
jgi:hypothetical protein